MKPATTHPRRWWMWPFGLALLAVLGLSALRWAVQPERLGAFVLQRAEAATGLLLSVEGPARLGIWPRLNLQLRQLTVSDPQRPDRPLATVEQVSLYLPLSALQGEVQIDSASLEAPFLDLGAWNARDAAQTGPSSAPILPTIAQLDIHHGSVAGDNWRIEGLELALEHLLSAGRPLMLSAQAEWTSESQRIPFAFDLSALNPAPDAPLSWSIEALRAGDGGAAFVESDAGRLSLTEAGKLALSLDAATRTWPQAWPPLPEPVRASLTGLSLTLDYDADHAMAPLRLRGEATGRRFKLALAPDELAGWWSQGDWLAPLPGTLELDMDQMELNGVQLEGLRIQHGPDVSD